MQSQTRLIDSIKAHELFNQLPESSLDDLETELELVRLSQGDILCRQGDPGDVMYIVVHGSLQVVTETPGRKDVTVNDIDAGVSVGEISLLTGQPRSATVYAKEETQLVQLSRAGFYRLTDKHPKVAETFTKRIMPRLQRNQLASIFLHLFSDKGSDIFDALQDKVDWQRLSAGELLFQQGDEGKSMYIVVNGRLQVVIENQQGGEHVLYSIGRGATIGEYALLTHETRSASVYALRDSHVVNLDALVFENLLNEYPQATLPILKTIVRQQKSVNNTFIKAKKLKPRKEMTVALIPVRKGLPLAEFSRQLGEVLGAKTILHLNSERFDVLLGKPGSAQIPKDHPVEIPIIAWLNEQESRYRFILYEADEDASQWTCRCIRQADRILLIGDGTSPTDLDGIESLIQQHNPRVQTELVLLQPADIRRPSGTERWPGHRTDFNYHHVRLNETADFRRLVRRLTNTANGLVLGGGGARGYAHIGVIRALHEAGIEIDFIGGTSMGAALGALYATGMDHEEILQIVSAFSSRKSLIDFTLPVVSITATKKLSRILRRLYEGVRIENLWRPFFCVSTNLTKAKPLVHQQGLLWEAVRASLSVPVLFTPVCSRGDVLVDGGLINNLPIDIMRDFCGGGLVIAVNVASPASNKRYYDFPPGLSGWEILWSKLNPFIPEVQAPRLIDILLQGISVNSSYNLVSIQDQADLLITPATDQFDSRAWDAYQDIVELGYQTAKQQIAEWQNQ